MIVQIVTENGVKKIVPLTADIGAGVPVGFFAPFAKKSSPSGWLYCDGSTFDENVYPALYQYLGTNKLPDLREIGLKGAEKNTTYIFDSTEIDPSTGQAGKQNHDVFAGGEFKDDCLQDHRHNSNDSGSGNTGIPRVATGPETAYTGAVYGSVRTGSVTRGKSYGIFWYVKATSGLPENQQDNVLATINTNNSYSTEEVNTGAKWIDGKPIYRKVIDCGALPNNTTKQVAHNISNVDRFIRYYGTARANTGTTFDIPYLGDIGYNYSVFVYLNNTNINVVTKADRSAYVSTYIILEYTKTTD